MKNSGTQLFYYPMSIKKNVLFFRFWGRNFYGLECFSRLPLHLGWSITQKLGVNSLRPSLHFMHCNHNVQGSKETSEFINIEQFVISHTSFLKNAKSLVCNKPRIEVLVVTFTSTQKTQWKPFTLQINWVGMGCILLKLHIAKMFSWLWIEIKYTAESRKHSFQGDRLLFKRWTCNSTTITEQLKCYFLVFVIF